MSRVEAEKEPRNQGHYSCYSVAEWLECQQSDTLNGFETGYGPITCIMPT